MAATLKRKRVAVSYRELSSDDDTDSSTKSEPSPRRAASRSQRSFTRTQPKPSSAAAASASHKSTTPTARSGTLRAQKQSRLSYKEPSSDEDDDDDFVEQYNRPAPAVRRSRRSRRSPDDPTPQQTRTLHKVQRQRHRIKQQEQDGKGKARLNLSPIKKKEKNVSIPIQSGNIPPWSSLPYHILLQIFVYASHPIQDHFTWLLQLALMRREFTEPALTALYRSPPFASLNKVQRGKLLEILLDQSKSKTLNYNAKVKRLELDSKSMIKHTSVVDGGYDLPNLIKSLPQLAEIIITDPADRPPYRRRARATRWHYPEAMFFAMEEASLRLRSFKWNATLFANGRQADQDNAIHEAHHVANQASSGSAPPLEWMAKLHTTKPFSSLTQVTLSQFAAEGTRKPKASAEGDNKPLQPSREELLATALASLPSLKGLIMEACTIVNGSLLPLLPQALGAINLTNCIYLTSDILGSFLITHGLHLKHLTLNHNQSLDLAFLPELKLVCPVLEVFSMDLTYYSTFATSNDADPLYDDLLRSDEVPSWPASLQHLEMLFLRKWNTEAVETFFQSLVDASGHLPHLRTLIIKATGIQDIGWRDRAQLRDKWIALLQHVYLAREKPLSYDYEAQLRIERAETDEKFNQPGKGKALSHVQIPMRPRIVDDADSDSDAPLVSTEGRALRPRTKPTITDNSDDSADSANDDDLLEDFGDVFIQGQCSIVDIMIDNLRPREEVYREEDFLDAELSGDEDWDENNDIDDEPARYAW